MVNIAGELRNPEMTIATNTSEDSKINSGLL